MNQDQINQLLHLLDKIASGLSQQQPYTITGAADWNILAAIGTILVGLIGFMWVDLRSTIKEHRTESLSALDKYKNDHIREHEKIEDHMRTCQEECCPPRGSRS